MRRVKARGDGPTTEWVRLKLPTLALCAALAAAAAPAAASAGGTGGAVAGQEPRPITAAASGGASPSASAPSSSPAPAPIVAADVPYGPLVAAVARRHGLSVSLFTALVWQESGFTPRARSGAGARGLTQLMPATARDLGVRRIYDPLENLDGGARYLVAQLLRFRSVELALAAYNAGPGAVVKHRGIPPFAETRRYVRSVLAIEARLRAAGVR